MAAGIRAKNITPVDVLDYIVGGVDQNGEGGSRTQSMEDLAVQVSSYPAITDIETGLVESIDTLSTNLSDAISEKVSSADLGGTHTVSGAANSILVTGEIDNYKTGQLLTIIPIFDNTGGTTMNWGDKGPRSVRKIVSGVDVAISSGEILAARHASFIFDEAADGGAGAFILQILTSSAAGGLVVQVKSKQYESFDSGSTTIPIDDTKPQNDQGDEYMSIPFTPKNAANTLKVEVLCSGSHSVNGAIMVAALFQDDLVSAVRTTSVKVDVANSRASLPLVYLTVAGTVTEIIFSVRIGGHVGGTFNFNGAAGSRELGGSLGGSIIVTEYEAE